MLEDGSMSALLMVLVAGMTVGNNPERISTRSSSSFPFLQEDLSLLGEWETKVRFRRGDVEEVREGVAYRFTPTDRNGQRVWEEGGNIIWIDEGKGRFRIFDETFNCTHCRGIYKWEGASLIVCLRSAREPRPTRFEVDKKTGIIILTRPKPGMNLKFENRFMNVHP
jgi:hypothetical protein